MAIEDFYNSMTRRIYTKGKNAQYEQTATVYSDSTINGYIGSRSSNEKETGGKFTIRTLYKFYADTCCNYGDEVIYDSETYRLIDDMHDAGNKLHHYKGILQKIDRQVE